MTRLGTDWPASKFTFEVVGSSVPSAKAVMCPPPVVLVTVTLRATAVTPSGIAPLPPTCTRVEPYAGTLPRTAPVPSRVSSRRVGVCATKSEPAVMTGNSLTTSAWLAGSVTVTLTLYSPSFA